MKISGFFSCLVGGITFILLIVGYLEYVHNLGFPDGYISEYARAGRIMYLILMWPFGALGVYCMYLGWNASKQNIHRKFMIAVFLLILCIAVMVIIDSYVFLHLDHGQGG
jgi:hypothetical protein